MIMQGERYVHPDLRTEARIEIEMLRARKCSYEAAAEEEEGLPSWNACFRCLFMACGTYSGPALVPLRGKRSPALN